MNNEEKILAILETMQTDISGLKQDVSGLKQDVASLQATVERHGRMLEELDERSLRSAVMLENDLAPKVQLLLEGQAHLVDTLAPKARVEVLEDEMITVKSSIKNMSQRLAALEKAQ